MRLIEKDKRRKINYECVMGVAHKLKRKTDIDKSTKDIRRGGTKLGGKKCWIY